MWIVKLGGSLTRDRSLLDWLRMLAEFGGGRVALVAGGGGFADAVRRAQRAWQLDDLAAHNMATLAMVQTALMLHSIEPRLVPATEDAEIRRALHLGSPALWLPYTVLRDAPDLLTSWDVTSDSLSLWLARRLNAERLVIVKSCAVNPQQSLAALSSVGVLDARFAQWAVDAPFPIEVVQRNQRDQVRNALLGAAMPAPPMA
ncbi:MAG TPA: aspartate kinase [Burkholderiaceae bacterium]|nr:aspartate kinase [Burkholderiaceae bacterium]